MEVVLHFGHEYLKSQCYQMIFYLAYRCLINGFGLSKQRDKQLTYSDNSLSLMADSKA